MIGFDFSAYDRNNYADLEGRGIMQISQAEDLHNSFDYTIC